MESSSSWGFWFMIACIEKMAIRVPEKGQTSFKGG